MTMQNYKALLKKLIDKYDNEGESCLRGNRTGVRTVSLFGESLRFNLQEGFPLVTIKKTSFHAIAAELLWFIGGSTNDEDLRKITGVPEGKDTIWTPWALEEDFISGSDIVYRKGSIGPLYGYSWRNFNGVDQLVQLIENLKTNPFSRRHIVSAWNPSVLPDEKLSPQENVRSGNMALAPCHWAYQFDVDERDGVRYLNLMWMQRSWDVSVGGSYNIASYALLCHLVASVCGYMVGDLIVSAGNVHLYEDQIEPLRIVLDREPKPLPRLVIKNPRESLFDFIMDDFEVVGYESHPFVKLPVAV